MTTTTIKDETLFSKMESLIKSTIDLSILKFKVQISDFIGTAVLLISLMTVILLILFVLNIGLALWIGDIIGTAYLGFLIVGVMYILCMFLVRVFFYESIKNKISNIVIRNI